MRYIIYGAGAIGSILGGHLQRAGVRVELVASAAHARAVRHHGLALVLPDKTHNLRITIHTSAAELTPFRAGDVILLCAKTQQTLRCLSELRRAGAPRSLPVFCCQNSLSNELFALQYFDHIYGVVLSVAGIFVRPGRVLHPSGERLGYLEIGRYPRGRDAVSRRLARDLRAAGFAVREPPDVMRTKRAKFVQNMANAAIAITGRPARAGSLVTMLRAEARAVLTASGLEWEEPADFLARAAAAVGPVRTPREAERAEMVADSAWQSLARRTGNIETPFFNGLLTAWGSALGVPTPANALVDCLAARMARNGERPGKYSAGWILARLARAPETGRVKKKPTKASRKNRGGAV